MGNSETSADKMLSERDRLRYVVGISLTEEERNMGFYVAIGTRGMKRITAETYVARTIAYGRNMIQLMALDEDEPLDPRRLFNNELDNRIFCAYLDSFK